MRRVLIPLIFIVVISLGAALPVSANPDIVIEHTEKECPFD